MSIRGIYRSRAVAMAVALSCAAIAAAPAAHATTLLNCVGTETLTFQPPLTTTPVPTQVHFAIDLDQCPAGGVSTGSSAGGFETTASCTVLDVLPPAFSDTYEWDTGTSSTATYIAPVETVVNGSLVVTDTGTVTGGLGQGALANETTTLPEPNLLTCSTSGVAQTTGPYALTFS